MAEQRDEAASERYRQEHARCLSIVARAIREEKGLTKEQVANRANVSVRWIERLETNRLGNYRVARLLGVIDALGVEIRDFYKRIDSMAGPPPWRKKENRHE